MHTHTSILPSHSSDCCDLHTTHMTYTQHTHTQRHTHTPHTRTQATASMEIRRTQYTGHPNSTLNRVPLNPTQSTTARIEIRRTQLLPASATMRLFRLCVRARVCVRAWEHARVRHSLVYLV